jgi:hypothetical protein
VFDPWRAKYVGIGQPAPDTPKRHYEVCDKHAEELWPHGEGYVDREHAEAIRVKAVAA